MLVLHGVTISIQNLGTILGVFLQGTVQKIQERYYSFWNFGATSGELEYWSDNCGLLWLHSSGGVTANRKLFIAMQRGALAEILNKGHTKKTNPYKLSCKIAETRIAQMDYITWYQATKIEEQFDIGDSVGAEASTGNFNDDVIGKTLDRHRIVYGKVDKRAIYTAITKDNHEETEEEDWLKHNYRLIFLSMKTYIVYVNGLEIALIKAANHNAAEKKAQKKYKMHPPSKVSVVYTEV